LHVKPSIGSRARVETLSAARVAYVLCVAQYLSESQISNAGAAAQRKQKIPQVYATTMFLPLARLGTELE